MSSAHRRQAICFTVNMDSATSSQLDRARFRSSKGFTIVEVVFAGCLLAVLVSASVVAMTQVNRWATGARLRTLALAVAQQRIDQVATTPWQFLGTRPALLTAGTITENSLPLNNDSFNSATGLASAFSNLDTEVNATRATVLTDLTARTVRATVTVSFTFRGRVSAVSLTTLRTSDNI